MNNKRLKTGFTSAFERLPQYIMSGVFGTLICFAVQVSTQDMENEQAFSISSQPLCSALTRFAEQSSSAEQYEAGIKTEFFGGRLRATLAYYDLTKTNVATPPSE